MSAVTCRFLAEFEQKSPALVQWSPDGKYLASTHDSRLVIRDASSLKIIPGGVRPCGGSISSLAWSPDSDMVLCTLCEAATILVFSLSRPDWSCKLREGVAGLATAMWAPSCRDIISTSGFGIHLSIWSLEDGRVWQVRQPKEAPGSIAFSADGALLAVATRRDCKDRIALHDASRRGGASGSGGGSSGGGGAWEALAEWQPDTLDLVAIAWSPCGGALCVTDSPLRYAFLVYGLRGEPLARFSAYENALGIGAAAAWSRDGALLALGSHDEVRAVVLSAVSQATVVAIVRKGDVANTAALVRKARCAATAAAAPGITFEDGVPDAPLPPAPTGAAAAKAAAAGGATAVRTLRWCPQSRYLATVCDAAPRVLWVWDAGSGNSDDSGSSGAGGGAPALAAAVLFMRPVLTLAWRPAGGARLAVATGTRRVYLWEPPTERIGGGGGGGMGWLDAPAAAAGGGPFRVVDARWHPAGGSLVMLSKDRMICVRLEEGGFSSDEGEGGGSLRGEQVLELRSRLKKVDLSAIAESGGSDPEGGDENALYSSGDEDLDEAW
ncbi:hypothetical protein JKP88DRAFT_299494 [Tribonema minus]|uniref:Uncharacterized protein n=1 Tax=Tribonema minus TaxID=303371 RepID=A0A835ZBU5_9STRA|nr:hypothetical protein JKP88DRAFT_299494 [Tribonema minus]